jgi:hypothetical protein
MSRLQTRLVSFGGATLALEYSHTRAARVVDFLYQHLPGGDETPPHLTYRLLSMAEDRHLALYREDTLIYQGASEAALADLFLADTCRSLVAQSRGGLLFHAAGLAWQNKGLMLPGQMGAGKSTLTAWLLTKGFNYLTDELVFIAAGSTSMQTFPRPLNLKRSARSVLRDWLDFSDRDQLDPAGGDQILTGPQSDLAPPTLLYPANTVSQPALRLIIFPHYQSEVEFEIQPLAKARAGLELMRCLVNARNLPEHGLPEIARLARQLPAYDLRYSSFARIGAQLENLMEQVS